MSKELTIYDYMRDWFDFCFENNELITPNHSALYFFILSHSNRMGWKPKFGLPTTMAKEAIGIRSYNTYIKALNDLVGFGFINMIEKSKNQYSSNIIALSKYNKAFIKALDKATIKHATKQSESTQQSIDSIIIQSTNTPINQETKYSNLSVNWDGLKNQFNEITGKKCNVVSDKVKRSIIARLKEGYTKDDIANAIYNCFHDPYHKETGHKYLTLEFISRGDKLEKYSTISKLSKPKKEEKL